MAEFLSNLNAELIGEDEWLLIKPLVYRSDIAGHIVIPVGFVSDLATVPRIPIIYAAWGDRAHREAVLHDFLYRRRIKIQMTFDLANRLFLEAMECRKVAAWIRYPMYWGVCLGGFSSFQKRDLFENSMSGLIMPESL